MVMQDPSYPQTGEFARAMDEALVKVERDHPGGWRQDKPVFLLLHLQRHLGLLATAIAFDNSEGVQREAVHCGNFLMMIRDVAKGTDS